MASGKSTASASPAWYEPALKAPTFSEVNHAAVLLMTAEGTNEKGKTAVRAASAVPKDPKSTFYPFFSCSNVAGLVPPF